MPGLEALRSAIGGTTAIGLRDTEEPDVNKVAPFTVSSEPAPSPSSPGPRVPPLQIVKERPTFKGNTEYDAIIAKAAERYNVDPYLVKAVIKAESAFNPKALSPTGAIGLMQLMPGTAKELGVDANNIAENINGGTQYLSKLLKQFNGDMVKAVAAYNAGPGAVNKYGGVPPYKETRAYVPRVLSNYASYTGGTAEEVPQGKQAQPEAPLPSLDKKAFGKERSDTGFLDAVSDIFIGKAEAAESTEERRNRLRQTLEASKKYYDDLGGWDKLNEKQKTRINGLIDEYKALPSQDDTHRELQNHIEEGFKQPTGKKPIGLDFGDLSKSALSTLVDVALGPPALPNSVVKSIATTLNPELAKLPPDQLDKFVSNMQPQLSFKRSFVEKFINSSTLNGVKFNLEKPIDQQTVSEILFGKAGSVLGTLSGYALPFGIMGKLLSKVGVVRPIFQNVLSGLGSGYTEGFFSGDAAPEKRALLYGATPLVLSPVLAGGAKLIKAIGNKRIQRFLTTKFVSKELEPFYDAAKTSKTIEEFTTAISQATVPKGFNPKVFFDGVKSGSVNRLQDAIRPLIEDGTLVSKKDIQIANKIEEFFQEGLFVQPKQLGAIDKIKYGWFKSLGESLTKLDPVNGKKIVEAVQKSASDERVILGKGKAILDKIVEGVSDKDFKTAVDLLEGKIEIKPGMEKIVHTANDMNLFFRTMGRALQKAGVSVKAEGAASARAFTLLDNYFPHKFTKETLDKFMSLDVRDIDGIAEFLVSSKQAKDISQAKEIWGGYVRNLALPPSAENKPFFMKGRTVNAPGYRTDKGVLYDYLDLASKRIARAQNYGPGGSIIKELAVNMEKKGVDPTYVKAATDRILGTDGTSIYRSLFRTARVLNSFAFGLPTTIVNASQQANIPIEAGMKAYLKGLSKIYRNSALIQKAGITSPEAIRNIRNSMTGTLEADGALEKVQKFWLNTIGFNLVEDVNRSVAGSTGIEKVRGLFSAVQRNPKDLLSRGVLDQYLSKQTVNKAVERGFINNNDLLKAAQKLEKDTQFWYLTTDLPLAFTSEFGKVATQFKASAYLHSMFLKKAVYDEFKKGNFKPAFIWATTQTALGELTNDARELIRGRNPFDPKNPRITTDIPQRTVENLIFNGAGLGVVSDAMKAVAGKGSEYTLPNFLFGPSYGKVMDVNRIIGAYNNSPWKGIQQTAKTGLGWLSPTVKGLVFPPKSAQQENEVSKFRKQLKKERGSGNPEIKEFRKNLRNQRKS